MFKPIQSILFATNLAENCRPAFDMAASLATRYQATLVLLHVIEKIPDYVEGRLKGLLGARQWQDISLKHQNEARQNLIGKKSSNTLIRTALEQFCAEAGIDDNVCGYHSREIVVCDGELVETIVSTARTSDCDMIVMGTKAGLISGPAIGATIKAVMRQSGKPVLVVPPAPKSK